MPTPKLGGEPKLRIFLKGNEDLRNSLLSVTEGGQRLERGLRDMVREKYQGAFDVEILHEHCGRSDHLLQLLDGTPMPAELKQFSANGGMGMPPAQFQTRLLEERPDVVVFSVQPDLMHPLWRHRQSGFRVLLPPRALDQMPPGPRQWFSENFSPLGPIPVEEFKDNLRRLIHIIKERLEAHMLVFNSSTIDPAEHVRNYHGRDDDFALRAQKFNLALMQLSGLEGISIIDVDRVMAEIGAQRHVLGTCRYSDEAYQAICQELLRVLEDIGFFEKRPLVMQLGQRGK